ncbi:hypothetical protein EON83_16945 [bacterium]|nr:MAG: hypothetical protein EON83_16945 [bacterium]
MSINLRFYSSFLLTGCLWFAAQPVKAAPTLDALSKAFAIPPDSARPQTLWHWTDGNVTKGAITADLEAMKRGGIGGAEIFFASQEIPLGPVRFMSPEWFEMVGFAASEAKRLGLDLSMHNCAGWSSSGGPWNTPENGMQTVTTSETRVSGNSHFDAALPQPETKLGTYREIAVLAFPATSDFRIPNYRPKAEFEWQNNVEPALGPDAPVGGAIEAAKIVNLTSQVKDGRLVWDVPTGDWIILRVGYTPTGRTNDPPYSDGIGLEVDKLSKSALDLHWKGMMGPVMDKLKSLPGRPTTNVHVDSYEVGFQNWTPEFAAEFKKRRGYDITPYLPVFTGRVVGSTALSERFLWDVRRTTSDLMSENYYGHFRELCHQNGVKFSNEAYGEGPMEELTAAGASDIPMGEFWVDGTSMASCKMESSSGHIYGANVVSAEAFTGQPWNSSWITTPESMKPMGDRAFCNGINRFVFHTFVMQPYPNRFPGMTMGQWGSHQDPRSTMWEPQRDWIRYITRSQFLLQQGHFEADALAFTGDNPDSVIFMAVGSDILRRTNPALPPGYSYDVCSADGLLKRISVKNGRLMTPTGTSYSFLLLPPNETMQLSTLRKIRDLVRAGAVVVGAPPKRSPSLENYPQCDTELATLTQQIWGDCDGKTVTSHAFGKGRIFWGLPITEVMTRIGATPDFSSVAESDSMEYIHRSTGKEDIYFVSNQKNEARDLECNFRVTGKVPELWHPETGRVEDAPLYREENGHTIVPLHFSPSDSVFVLFRRAAKAPHFSSANWQPEATSPNLEIINAVYEAVDGTGTADVTETVRGLVKDRRLNLTANTPTLIKDPAPWHVKQLVVQYRIGVKTDSITIPEHQNLALSADSLRSYPDYEWTTDARGTTRLVQWENGSLSVQRAKGSAVQVPLPNVTAPQEISGPWTLSFPPNWGAPPQVTLDKLISWPQHSDAGVRYFSGTATYSKNFDLPASAIGANKVVSLDLGAVKNVARVKLNGRDLGLIWKAPFRADLSGVARAGTNQLEVQVTNLWPNRLIGDEQLPPDAEWVDNHIKAWPQWLLEGKPSPTGRLTFSTWHHYNKDSPLLPSGLLGPATIHTGNIVNINP